MRSPLQGLSPTEFFRGLKNILRQKPRVAPGLEDNPVLELLVNRRSVRSFLDRPIPDDVFDAILEAGRLAPSGVNLQTWSFACFDRPTWKETFGSALPYSAPRAVMVLGDIHRVRRAIEDFPHKPLVEYTLAVTNAGIAAYAMNVAAEALGVGSVMLSETGRSGFYDASFLKDTLALPEGVFPLTTLILGYPKKISPGMPPKLPRETITFTGRYREPDQEVLDSWMEQMKAGYRALKITESFAGKLEHYRSKLDQAEEGLEKIIFHRRDREDRRRGRG